MYDMICDIKFNYIILIDKKMWILYMYTHYEAKLLQIY